MTIDRAWHFSKPIKLTVAKFEALPVGNPMTSSGCRPWREYRLQMDLAGRRPWHVVTRQYQFGTPVYYARPITITLTEEISP